VEEYTCENPKYCPTNSSAAAMSSLDDLRLDLTEAETLLASATRDSNKKKLEGWVSQLAKQVADAESMTTKKLDDNESNPAVEPLRNKPVLLNTAPAAAVGDNQWQNIESFAWDQGEYNTPWVTVYLTSGLDGVGQIKDRVSCDFATGGFDLQIRDLGGKNLRLVKENLDKDVIPEQCKFVVKKNSVNIKLKKVKGEYSYEHWTDLTSKKSKEAKKESKDNPMGGIMDMMKDMYDNGDEQMKKTIGEAMMKANSGEKSGPPGMDSMDSLDD